jgi:polyhydroxybutyrate depolymerase
VISAIAVLLLVAAPEVQSFTVEGMKREALVYTGSNEKPIVVVAFHGHGGNMRQAARSFGVHTLWPEATVIYPQGLPSVSPNDPEGKRNGWQVRGGTSGNRDVKFVDAILRSVKNIDPKRTFAMGHSNGGAMTYVLWAERHDKFAAFGPSGSPGIQVLRFLKPAPVFHTAGENDRIVSYSGQKLTIDRLKQLNGVDETKGTKAGFVTLYGATLGTYIHPGGHQYPAAAAKATVEFFKKHAT